MKYLIVGISVRATVESAVRSGYSVLALDAFGDQDTRLLAETHSLRHDFAKPYSPAALLECAGSLAFDAVGYTSNLENYPDILEQLSQKGALIGNSPSTVRAIRSWPRFFLDLRQAGFDVPETIFAGETLYPNKGCRWLKKPLAGGGGHGISFVIEEIMPDESLMFQKFIPGIPCSASFVANGKECVVLGITEQLVGVTALGVSGFRYCGNILPLSDSWNLDVPRLWEQVNRLAGYFTQAYGLVGLNGIDFIFDDGRVYTTEVNPRYSASMELIERAYGLPMFDIHLKAVSKGVLPEFHFPDYWNGHGFCGKAILFAAQDAKAPDTSSWYNRGIRDIPVYGEILRAGAPICTLMTTQSTREKTLGDLIFQAEALKEEIYR